MSVFKKFFKLKWIQFAKFGFAIGFLMQPYLASAEPIRGRLERVSVDASPASCFVDYAHTPDAIENVLETLREITPGRLFIVFGAGGDRAEFADDQLVTDERIVVEDVLLEIGEHLWVVPVQVRLGRVEQVQVPVARGLARGVEDARPAPAVEDAAPVVRRLLPVLAASLADDIAVPLG